MKISIVGAGRAGTSFAAALSEVGHDTQLIHHDELERVGQSEVVLLYVPDDAIAEVSQALAPRGSRVVLHVAGSRGLSEVASHPRAARWSRAAARTWPSGSTGRAAISARPARRMGPMAGM